LCKNVFKISDAAKCLSTNSFCIMEQRSAHARWFAYVLLLSRVVIVLWSKTCHIRLSDLAEGLTQWPLGLRRRSAATRLLRLLVRIPPETWMFVCCECCVLSGRGVVQMSPTDCGASSCVI
jgi:hypothetical protein